MRRIIGCIGALVFLLIFHSASAQSIVINEVSQGPAGSEEYVEFLVVPPSLPVCGVPPCLDLRLWIFDDNNGYLNGGPTTGVGIASGACRFANDPFWSCIPAGTTILIYNDLATNAAVPSPDDLSMADGNCALVIPISSTLFERHATQPNSTDGSYAATGWVAGGSWTPISMANGADGFQIYDPANLLTPVFSIGWGAANNGGDIWMGAGSASDDVFYMDANTSCDWYDQNNWVQGCAGDPGCTGTAPIGDQTPGAQNTAANGLCIGQMNNNCGPPLDSDTTFVDETCLGFCDGSATVTVTGGVPGYTYFWSPAPGAGQGTPSVTGLCAGVYTVDITDAGGCVIQTSVTIAPGSAPPTLNITQTNVSCNGVCDGEITATAAGGSPPYEYSIDGGPFSATNVFSGLCAGSYDITAQSTGVGGLQTIWTEDFDGTPCTSGCDPSIVGWNNNATVGPNGASANTWYVSCAENGNAAGMCGSGCGADNSLHIGNVSTSTSAILWCPTGDCGAAYDASTAAEITNKRAESPVINCTGFTGITVDFNYIEFGDGTLDDCHFWYFDGITWANIDPMAKTACCGGPCGGFNQGQWAAATIALPASADNNPNVRIGYFWTNNGDGIGTDPSVAIDDIVVQGTAPGGSPCPVTVTVTITEPPVLTVTTTSADASCNGVCDGDVGATANGGTSPYTYTWTVLGAGQNFTGSVCAGTYTVTVTDANGCTANANATVTEPPALNGTLNSTTDATCGSCNGAADVSASGGTSPYSYDIGGGPQGTGIFTGLCAGSHNVTITDANGCTFVVPLTINDLSGLTASINAQTNVSCNGVCDGSVTVAGSGGTTPYTYDIGGGPQASGTFSGLCAGAYTVTVTDNSGCTTTVPVTITEPTAVGGSITAQTNASCNGVCDGSVTVAGSGGTTPYMYDIGGGPQASGTFTGLCAGPNDVTVIDANGCTFVVPVTITEPTAVGGTLNSTTDATCGSCNGAADVTASGGTTPYTYDIGGGPQASGVFTALCAGAYNVTITDANGCTFVIPVVINDLSGLSGTIAAQNDVSCFGLCDGDVTVAGSGGVSPYTYDIGGGPQASGTFTGLCAGNYTVTVTDDNGCTFPVAITITEPAPFTATTTVNNNVSCFGACDGEAYVDCTGPWPCVWQWDDPSSQTDSLLDNVCAGTYTVLVTNANGCTATATVTITEPPLLTAATTSASASCNGVCDGDVGSTGSGGTTPYTYSWTVLGPGQDFIGTVCAGTYDVTITDANGCTATAPATVTEPPVLTAVANTVSDASAPGACDGVATVTPGGGTSPYTYLWDPAAGSQTTQTATGLCAGTYCVDVTDANGCVVNSCTVIIEPGMIGITGTQVGIDCFGNCNGSVDVTISGGVTPYTYTWTGPGGPYTTEDLTGLCAGTYDLTVTDNNSVTANYSVTITEPAALTSTVAGTDVLCNGQCDGTIDLTIGGGTTPYAYAWNGPGGFTSALEDLTALCAGTYDVVVTDGNGCVINDTYTINEPAAIALTTSMTSSNCGQADGSVTVTATGGTVAVDYAYQWEDAIPTVVGTTATVTGLPAGTYTITVTDDNGCTATTTETITDIGGGTATTTADVNASCNGLCDGQATVTMAGGTTPYTYLWNAGSTPTAATTGGLCAGIWDVVVTDAAGCVSNASVTITEPAPINVAVAITNEICAGDCQGSVDVSANGGSTPYLYSIDNCLTSVGTTLFSGLCAGTYDVCVTDANGCTGTMTADVLVGAAAADATIAPAGPYCEDASPVNLNGADPGGTWSGTGITDPVNGVFDPAVAGPGMHTITYSIGGACGDTQSIDILVNPLPTVTAIGDVLSGCEPLTVTFTSTGTPGISCLWDFGDGNTSTDCGPVTHTYTNAGSYDVSLTVTDANGCTNSVTSPGYINVFPNPVADFTWGPQPTTILDPAVDFTDQSIDAATWAWDFAGMGTSMAQNPSFNFTNVGSYDVTLLVTSPNGCTDMITQTIVIDPEFIIYVPNAITNDDDGLNEIFLPVISGEDPLTYELMIFDRWGELLFETDNPNLGWDGTYRGVFVETEVYVWKIKVKDMQGEFYNYIGHVTVLK